MNAQKIDFGGETIITEAVIEANIASEWYISPEAAFQVPKDHPLCLLTICIIVMRNGFTVTGESACGRADLFNEEIGRKVARRHAIDKIYSLLGFLAKDAACSAKESAIEVARSESKTQDDVIAGGYFWMAGQRYRRNNLNTIVAVDNSGNPVRQEEACIYDQPVDYVEIVLLEDGDDERELEAGMQFVAERLAHYKARCDELVSASKSLLETHTGLSLSESGSALECAIKRAAA